MFCSNVGEAMVSKGFATVIRYRQDDDQRASCYDDLLSAEAKAIKSAKGLHNKKETPLHRVADISSVCIITDISVYRFMKFSKFVYTSPVSMQPSGCSYVGDAHKGSLFLFPQSCRCSGQMLAQQSVEQILIQNVFFPGFGKSKRLLTIPATSRSY